MIGGGGGGGKEKIRNVWISRLESERPSRPKTPYSTYGLLSVSFCSALLFLVKDRRYSSEAREIFSLFFFFHGIDVCCATLTNHMFYGVIHTAMGWTAGRRVATRVMDDDSSCEESRDVDTLAEIHSFRKVERGG